jgi:hypothetical protein
MAKEPRSDGKRPEDEGQPDFDEDLESRRKVPDYDEGVALPGDRPLEANDLVTAAEQRRGEPVRTRLARELPEDAPARAERLGKIYEETDEDGNDVNRELVADETDETSGLSPEEAAMHVVEEGDEL